jgi:hypothetical protein
MLVLIRVEPLFVVQTGAGVAMLAVKWALGGKPSLCSPTIENPLTPPSCRFEVLGKGEAWRSCLYLMLMPS